MVDNKNQWDDDIEYSEENEDEQDYGSSETDINDDYSNQEYDEDDSYDEYDEEDGERPAKKKKNPLPLLLVFLVLVGIVIFLLITKFGVGKTQVANNNQIASEQVMNNQGNQENQDSGDLTDTFFNEAGGDNSDLMSVNFNEEGETNVEAENGEGVVTVTEANNENGNLYANEQDNSFGDDLFGDNQDNEASSDENNAIMVSYNKSLRTNPFKPPEIVKNESPYEMINDTNFEIIEPPVSSVPDVNLTRLLQTQISGILYDEESPSAIVNLNGVDSFVKIGDEISGYVIQDISRNKVQISYKNNSYVAAVGELFTRGALEKQQAVANLENKFAGRNRD